MLGVGTRISGENDSWGKIHNGRIGFQTRKGPAQIAGLAHWNLTLMSALSPSQML
jgi:hypothetical protein